MTSTYEQAFDDLHQVGPTPDWQESCCTWFYDLKAGLGGFLRIGRRPVAGAADLILFLFTDAGDRFRRVETLPLSLDTPNLAAGSAATKTLGPNRISYSWSEPDAEGALNFEGFHTPSGWGPSSASGEVEAKMQAGHLECAGRLVGGVRLGKRRYVVNALAHRDRSWGDRVMGVVVDHRLLTGVVGPELSFASAVLRFKGGQAHKVGFVVREGRIQYVKDVELLPVTDVDNMSVLTGVGRFHLDGGEVIEIAHKTAAGVMHLWRDYVCTEHIGRVRCSGREGFADFEFANNPRLGTHVPAQSEFTRTLAENGWFPAPEK